MKFNHIIIITQDFPPGAGGIQTWCVQLTKQFADRGYQITVITKSFDEYKIEPFVYKDIKVIRLPHEDWGKKKNMLCYKALKEVVTSTSIVLASNWKMGVPALFYNIFRKVPYFTVCHGLDAIESRRKNRILQRRVFQKSAVSIAVSNFTKKLMVENNIVSEINVINNGAEISKYFKTQVPESILQKFKFDRTKLNLLNMGRLIERKGFDYTIKAIADLPEVVFHIGGIGNIENDLREMVSELNISDRVHFHGYIEDKDVNYLYNAADLFIMPARIVGHSVEGFGITYLEAAAVGTPSIGSFNSGAEDAIENGKSGLLVDGESPESIKNGIKYFIDNPDEIEKMGDYALNRVKDFTWNKVADKFLRTFEEYLNKK